MEKKHFIELIDKYLSQTATPAEQRLLEEYYAHLAAKGPTDLPQEDEDAIRAEILKKIALGEKRGRGRLIPMRYGKRAWIAAAFAGALLLCTGGWFLMHYKGQNRAVIAKAPSSSLPDDIAPGGNKAVLTLGDGTRIVLDTAKNGAVTAQGNMQVVKLNDGQLAYNAAGANSEANAGGNPNGGNSVAGGGDSRHGRADGQVNPGGRNVIVYNTLTTPRGGQYKITLSDGSKVWLNAASSLRYPSAFAGKERTVEITGEAYFEVAPLTPEGGHEKMPFIVKVGDAEVQVLGTHFNVMAYDDEANIKTTLLEGAVKVRKGDAALLLRPGQQASLHPGGGDGIKLVSDVDADEILAWKNNLFSFNNDDIQTVMRQIARWYAVDVRYEGKVTQHFNGNISREVNVSKLFKMLELTGTVHFRIEDNSILVSP
jgi:transmembrane sensor